VYNYHVSVSMAIWLLFQSPDGAAAVMSPHPYYITGNQSRVMPTVQYPDDLDDDDTDWDRLL